MKRPIPHHVYTSFDALITGMDTTLVDEMEKPTPNWSRGAKEVLPHIMWTYNSGDVDASEDRKEEGKYENILLSLCLCHKNQSRKKQVTHSLLKHCTHGS